MPNKAKGRFTVSRWPEVLLPMVAGQKNEPRKACLFLSRVSKTVLLSPDVLMGG
jgi:hypothetical protein